MEQQEPKEPKETRVQMDIVEPKVLKVEQVILAHKEPKETKVT